MGWLSYHVERMRSDSDQLGEGCDGAVVNVRHKARAVVEDGVAAGVKALKVLVCEGPCLRPVRFVQYLQATRIVLSAEHTRALEQHAQGQKEVHSRCLLSILQRRPSSTVR